MIKAQTFFMVLALYTLTIKAIGNFIGHYTALYAAAIYCIFIAAIAITVELSTYK